VNVIFSWDRPKRACPRAVEKVKHPPHLRDLNFFVCGRWCGRLLVPTKVFFYRLSHNGFTLLVVYLSDQFSSTEKIPAPTVICLFAPRRGAFPRQVLSPWFAFGMKGIFHRIRFPLRPPDIKYPGRPRTLAPPSLPLGNPLSSPYGNPLEPHPFD